MVEGGKGKGWLKHTHQHTSPRHFGRRHISQSYGRHTSVVSQHMTIPNPTSHPLEILDWFIDTLLIDILNIHKTTIVQHGGWNCIHNVTDNTSFTDGILCACSDLWLLHFRNRRLGV